MTVNLFLDAIARKLTGLWPGRKVFLGKIPRDAQGAFFVGARLAEEAALLDRRRRRAVQFEVLYFLSQGPAPEGRGSPLSFHEWAETMFREFQRLRVRDEEGERLFRLKDLQAQEGEQEGVFQFLFDAEFLYLLPPEPLPVMETLQLEEEIV